MPLLSKKPASSQTFPDLGIPKRVNSSGRWYYLTEAQKNRFAPRAHELNALVEQLRKFASADYEKALTVAEQFGPKARVQLDDASFPILAVGAARAQKAQMNIDSGTQGIRA